MKENKVCFENRIENFAVEDAMEFYQTKKVPVDSSMWCEAAAKYHGRDVEEAKILYSCLFPHAYHYVGEIENIKRNAI
jgi:hypothetical protein